MKSQDAPEQLARMITGYWVSQAIYATAKFGISDLLKDGPRPVDELAAITSTHGEALYRLLRALASVGVFSEGPPKVFSLTPLAELLRSDVAGSQRSLALMVGGQQFHAWGHIDHSIQTGETAFEHLHGKPLFDFLAEQPAMASIFDEAMTGIHGRETAAVLDAYDFSGIDVLADVGGGNGSNLLEILAKYPSMKGILFDLPHVVDRARGRVESSGLSDRCQLIGGDFFSSAPAGADAYLLRHIIHDWDDAKAAHILRNCRAAMPPSGKLLVVETVIPPGNAPFAGKLLDLTMLLIPGGKERTADEYQALYEQAGFELTNVVPSSLEVSVVEGAPI